MIGPLVSVVPNGGGRTPFPPPGAPLGVEEAEGLFRGGALVVEQGGITTFQLVFCGF